MSKKYLKTALNYGGSLRNQRNGRGSRPLSTKYPIHLVLKANRECIRSTFRFPKQFALIHLILKKYAKRFFIKVEQVTVQGDHIHLVIRISWRRNCHDFFRVFAGQIAQRFEKEGLLVCVVTDTPKHATAKKRSGRKRKKLWKHRPFTRIVKGWRAYRTVRNYVQLNEKEALGEIPYRKERLRGLSSADWKILWA